MRYPVPYVLVTQMEAGGAVQHRPPMSHRALTALTTPAPHQVLTFTSLLAASKKIELTLRHVTPDIEIYLKRVTTVRLH